MIRCGVVEPIIRGFMTVKFDDEPTSIRLPLKAWEQCKNVAGDPETDGRFVFNRCEKHSKGERP